MSARVAGVSAVLIAWSFGALSCWQFADWPWIAAAFNAPLWATLGALYVTGKQAAPTGEAASPDREQGA